ncbi:MAG TPA: LD-carboxypeptidase [Flavisolibacter sp.]|nr:LD-carboxypeptidase [Flavisolibacter sp.]
MIKFPPYLEKGNCIGMVAPAGFMPFEKMETCVNTLQDWGYNVRLGSTTHSNSSNYFSGTDEERMNDLQQMMDDKEIHAILCARGGYGTSRIIDTLSFKKFKKHPKWIIGFSDITVLHSHLYSRYGIASLHAPMAAAFNDEGYNSPYIQSLQRALEGMPAHYECAPNHFNKNGRVEGELVGGNLSLLAHLVGSPSDIKTKNKILFLEDIGEYLYNVDRMLLQLKRSGKFNKLAALIIGGFSEMKDTERQFGKPVADIIYDQVKEFDFPICFDFPVSHDKENYALKIGATYSLDIQSELVTLQEI